MVEAAQVAPAAAVVLVVDINHSEVLRRWL